MLFGEACTGASIQEPRRSFHSEVIKPLEEMDAVYECKCKILYVFHYIPALTM